MSITAAIDGCEVGLVDACRECNGLLSNKVFETLEERENHVKQVLRQRYKKLLKMPDWEREELAELGPTLRRTVLQTMALKRAVQRRLDW